MPDDMSPMDRDCIVAAILTNGMRSEYDAADAKIVMERFGRILKELRGGGGSAELWQRGNSAAQRKAERRERRKIAAAE